MKTKSVPNVRRCFFVVVFLCWPGQELSTLLGADLQLSLCSFTLLCLEQLIFYLCLYCGQLPGTPFLHCDLCLHRNRIKPLSYCPDQLRRQVYCRHTLLELRGPWASPGTLSPSLPIVHQSPITIYPTDLPPPTSIHLRCQYLRPSYLCTFIGCSNPLISLLSLLTLTTSPLYYFQNHLPPKQIWNYHCPPSTLHGI